MGMPLYGQAFTLDDANEHGLNAPARQKGKAGQFTKAAGFLAYYEICKNIQQGGWTVVEDPEGRMGHYAHKGRQWVGYDDTETIRRKSEYVREMGLGGGMVWALDLDDFKNTCGEGPHPLMNEIKKVLGPAKDAYSGVSDDKYVNTKDVAIETKSEANEDDEPETEPEPEAEPSTDTEVVDEVKDEWKKTSGSDGYKVSKINLILC